MTPTLKNTVLNTLVYECQVVDVERDRDRLFSQFFPFHPSAHCYSHYLYGYEC